MAWACGCLRRRPAADRLRGSHRPTARPGLDERQAPPLGDHAPAGRAARAAAAALRGRGLRAGRSQAGARPGGAALAEMSAITAELRLGRARMLPFAWWLAAPALLGLSRLAPTTGVGLGFRLIAATACLLIPGALIARALGLEGAAPTFVWSLAALFAG